MKVLDLYCGSGGAAVGIQRAIPSAVITGVDIEFQPDYPFWFFQANVIKLPVSYVKRFDFIWASPPCQAYSIASRHHIRRGKQYPDLIAFTRELLLQADLPFVIENVPNAPLRKDLMLCGEMFGLGVIRHRIFEIYGFSVSQPRHKKHKGLVRDGFYVTVAGNGGNDPSHNYMYLRGKTFPSQLACWSFAMGIDWIQTRRSMAQAVPPAYSAYILSEWRNT